MAFFVLGVNHQTASVALREQVAFSAETLPLILASLAVQQHVSRSHATVAYSQSEQSHTHTSLPMAHQPHEHSVAVATLQDAFHDFSCDNKANSQFSLSSSTIAATEPTSAILQQTASACTAAPHDLVVLSTCNRTEIYAITDSPQSLLNWLAAQHRVDLAQLQAHVYVYQDSQAVCHLMRVASGLDSLMLGEPQILGQVKHALNVAKTAGVVSAALNRIFEQAFYAAKRVRSETAVGAHAVSLGYAVAQLARQLFSNPEQLTVLLIAAGEMNSLVAKHMVELGVQKIIICNRSASRAQALAQQIAHRVHVEMINFTQLSEYLVAADVISSCTGSLHTVVHYADIKRALKQRRYQQMLLVDLAVPRDIDAAVDDLDGVYLYGVDDLQSVIDENLAQRRQAAIEAEVLVNQLATQWLNQQKTQRAGHAIQQYREQTQQLREQELAVAQQALANGVDAASVLEQLAHRLTAKLSHPTSVLLREAAQSEDPEQLLWLEQHLNSILAQRRDPKNEA